jgi:hypothetical protein
MRDWIFVVLLTMRARGVSRRSLLKEKKDAKHAKKKSRRTSI